MTVQNQEIQSILDAIESILPKSKGKPWLGPSEVAKLRLVIEQLQNYLASESFNIASPQSSAEVEVARKIGVAVAQEIDRLRESSIRPLQVEIEALQQQRDLLVKDIRKLETQQQYYQSIAQQQAQQQQLVSDFIQMLTEQLQASFVQQVTQTLVTLETQTSPYPAETSLHAVEHLEQLRQMQAQSDKVLTSLDSTIQVVFDTLQRNIQAYQESLSQGLEKMHGLGQQSEVLFTELVNNLKQQLRAEPAPSLRPWQRSSSERPPAQIVPLPRRSPLNSPPQVEGTKRQFPFPGMELPAAPEKQEIQPKLPNRNDSTQDWENLAQDINSLGVEAIADEEIEEFLQRELDALAPTTQQADSTLSSHNGEDDIELLYNLLFNPQAEANIAASPMTQNQTQANDGIEEAVFEQLSDFVEPSNPSEIESFDVVSPKAVANDELEEIEVIETLTDLFSERFAEAFALPEVAEAVVDNAANSAIEVVSPEQLKPDANSSLVEDTYIAASPEESLLVTDVPAEANIQALLEKPELIEQLNRDLPRFESADLSPLENLDLYQKEDILLEEQSQPTQEAWLSDEVVVEDWENEEDYPDLFALEPLNLTSQSAIAQNENNPELRENGKSIAPAYLEEAEE